MPIIACPNCLGKLKFPEDTPPRRVKCPTCGHVFMSSAGGDAAAPAAPGSVASRPARSDFEYDDRPSRRRDEDDDRGRRRWRDDEDDDRRSRRRRDDDDDDRDRRRRRDDDDDDDRDRRSRRRRDDDDDDYDRRPRKRSKASIEGQFDRASIACLMLFIAGWLLVGALGVMVFVRLLVWAELHEGTNIFRIIGGLLGLGHLLTAAVGYGFLVSGPREKGGLGLSIATAATGAFHLILVLLVGTVQNRNIFGDQVASVSWPAFVTVQNGLGDILMLLLATKGNLVPGGAILTVFANLAELAVVMLFLLTLRSVARNARDSRRAKMVMHALIANCVAAGILLVAGILFGILLSAVRFERGGADAVFSIYYLVVYFTLAAVAVWTTLVIRGVKDGIDYRPD